MPGPVYQDSMARCEPSSMLYDTIRNPRAPYIPPVQEVVKPDTIESTQQRVDREVLERFQGSGRKLPHDSFVAVVHVGKYVFLAIMLPPYLCMYGIPRWFLVTALPHLFHFVKNQSTYVGRFIQDLASRLVDLMKGMIEQMIGDALKMTQRHAKNLWGYLTARTQDVINKIAQAAAYCQKQLMALQHSCMRPLTAPYEKLAQVAREASEWTNHKLTHVGRVIESGVQQAWHLLVANVLSPVHGGLQIPFSKAKERVEAIFAKAAVLTSAAYQQIKHWMAPLVAAGYFVGQQVHRLWQDYAQPVVAWLQIHAERAKHVIDSIWEKVSDVVTKINQKIGAKVNEIFTPAIDATAQMFQVVPDLCVQAAYWMWGLVPQPVKQRLRKHYEKMRRSGHALKRFGQGVSSGLSSMVSGVAKSIIVPLQRRWYWWGNLVKWALLWLRRQLIEFPRRVEIAVIKLWRASKRMGSRTIFCLRLTFAWIRVIFKYGMGLVRELADEIAGWVLFRKRA